MGQGKGCTGGLGCTLIFFLLFFTIEGEGGILYIWSAHYACSARGWGLFDHQKQSVVRGCFCWPFSLFVTFCYFFYYCNFCKLFFYYSRFTVCYFFITFFTTCNFHKLLFTVEKGNGNYFIVFIHCLGGGGAPWFFFFFFLLLKGRGKRLISF